MGASITSSPSLITRSVLEETTVPITEASTPRRRAVSSTSSTDPGSAKASILSSVSAVSTPAASISSARMCTAERSRSIPTSERRAGSVTALASPAPPRSWRPFTRPCRANSRHTSSNRLASSGSPSGMTWGEESARLRAPVVARVATPPTLSGPVEAPSSTSLFPSSPALPNTSSSRRRIPTHITFTRGLLK